MQRRKYFRSTAILLGGGIASAACSFLRNIIIARLISVEDFGIAATFAMTMSLIEMASNLALDRLIVQAPDGEAPRLLATAHAFQVLRGVIAAIVLFLVAAPVARLFEVPDAVWAFQILALVPLIRGFAHLDVARLQREQRFGAFLWVDSAPQLLVTLAAAPLALWLGDYRVMLWVVLAQVSTATLLSHVFAERRYTWAWDRAIIRRMIIFGWPLLIDGVLIFATFHGEKIIIGSSFDMERLGWYSGALTLVMAPSLLLSSVLTKMLLPALARSQDHPEHFARKYAFTAQLCLLAGSVYACGMVIAGDELLILLFGDKYAAGAAVLPWLALAYGLRVARIGQSTAAIARADTRMALYMNAVRTLSVPAALGAVYLGYGLEGIAISALIGELAAMLASHALVRYRLRLPLAPILPMLGVGLVVLGGASVAWLGHTASGGLAVVVQFAIAAAVAILASAVLYWSGSQLRSEIQLLAMLSRKIPRQGPSRKTDIKNAAG